MAVRIDRLKLLRRNTKLSQQEIADKIGVKYGTYRNWEQGVREPGTDALISLSLFFEVSVDYLLGQSDVISSLHLHEDSPSYGHQNDDTNSLLEILKNDPQVRMVAKIVGELTPDGKKDLLKYAELLRNQKNSEWID